MRWITALLMAILCSAPAPLVAADKEVKPPNPLSKPPNPLLADPFVGEFEGDDLVLTVKRAGDKSYEGEFRRSGQTFPFKATRDGGKYAGAFTFEEFSYDFTATFDGATLKIKTDEKEFALKRRAAAADNPPPATPIKPAIIDPPPQPAPALDRIDYAKLSTSQLQQLSWTRFGAGSFAVFDESAGTLVLLQDPAADASTTRLRSKAVLDAVRDGKAALSGFRLDGSTWVSVERAPAAPLEDSLRIDELGYTRGESRAESLVIENVTVKCERTTYQHKITLEGSPMLVTADVWRSKEIDKPALTMDLPQKRSLLVEPDMARVQVALDYKGVRVNMNLEVTSLRREAVVSQRAVTYAIVKNTTKVVNGKTVLRRAAEYWSSHQVPGGLLKFVETDEKGTDIMQRQGVLVAFEARPLKPAPGK